MSTRCQVMITSTGLDWTDKVMLYHHWDGYPSNIVPLLQQARRDAGGGWESGRVGKAAGFICCSDPGQFEPEADLDLHSDIEYLYVITLINKEGGSTKEEPLWNLAVMVPTKSFWKAGGTSPTIKDMETIWEGGISKANGQEIEDAWRNR